MCILYTYITYKELNFGERFFSAVFKVFSLEIFPRNKFSIVLSMLCETQVFCGAEQYIDLH